MGKIKVKELGLEYVSKYNDYKDLGFVNDVEEVSEELYNTFAAKENIEKVIFGERRQDTYHGLYMGFKSGKNTMWYTCYESLDKINDIFLPVHEKAHVVHATGRTDLLKDLVDLRKLKVFDVFWDFWSCNENERELVANLVGIRGLEMKGIRILRINEKMSNPDFFPALTIYQRALFYDSFR